MRRKAIKMTLLAGCLLILFPLLATAEERRDGNWWRDQDKLLRTCYLVGFYDGMELGHQFSYWEFAGQKKEMEDCGSKVLQSYHAFNTTYVAFVSAGQLVDGLDSFYADFRMNAIPCGVTFRFLVRPISITLPHGCAPFLFSLFPI